MAEETTDATRLECEDVADRLNLIASELRNGDSMDVTVGNKSITLNPPSSVNYRIDVVETQRRFRGDRETVRVELDWQPE